MMMELIATVAATSMTAAAEITVTAERRPSSLIDAPRSISILPNEDVVGVGADHVSEILNRAAGVNIHRGSGQEHLTAIRSPVLTGGAGAGSFLFLENGTPMRSAGFANVNGLLEAHTEIADRVEIVKGPSGAFYGANAIHGAVNVISPSGLGQRDYFDISVDTIARIKARGVASARGDSRAFSPPFPCSTIQVPRGQPRRSTKIDAAF